jgi:MFS family permease
MIAPPIAERRLDIAGIQQRTVRLLFLTQAIAGVGVAVGGSVGALLAAELAGVGLSGVAQSATVVGAALFAVPAAAIVQHRGRRPSLAAGYALATLGALLVVAAAMRHSVALLFTGLFLFGCSSAAGYQARYAAVDLATTALRGRQLSLVVWATTIGAVIGPSLAGPASTALAPSGVPALAGPFFLSAVLFAIAAAMLLAWLRPDPAEVVRSMAETPEAAPHGASDTGVRAALPIVLSHPGARLGVAAMAVAHVVMVGIMAMTPVHIRAGGHDAAHTLRLVGLILSAHIAGMYAAAPVFGWLTDRLGRRSVVGVGVVLLLLACTVAGTAGQDPGRLAGGLTLVGLGWSASMVAGATLLSESIPMEMRASAQGLSDLTMGLAAATAGALSGLVLQTWGYSTLTLLAALVTAPLGVLMVARR